MTYKERLRRHVLEQRQRLQRLHHMRPGKRVDDRGEGLRVHVGGVKGEGSLAHDHQRRRLHVAQRCEAVDLWWHVHGMYGM